MKLPRHRRLARDSRFDIRRAASHPPAARRLSLLRRGDPAGALRARSPARSGAGAGRRMRRDIDDARGDLRRARGRRAGNPARDGGADRAQRRVERARASLGGLRRPARAENRGPRQFRSGGGQSALPRPPHRPRKPQSRPADCARIGRGLARRFHRRGGALRALRRDGSDRVHGVTQRGADSPDAGARARSPSESASSIRASGFPPRRSWSQRPRAAASR